MPVYPKPSRDLAGNGSVPGAPGQPQRLLRLAEATAQLHRHPPS
jgi:hypothetical protein